MTNPRGWSPWAAKLPCRDKRGLIYVSAKGWAARLYRPKHGPVSRKWGGRQGRAGPREAVVWPTTQTKVVAVGSYAAAASPRHSRFDAWAGSWVARDCRRAGCRGRPDKRYRTNPSVIAKIAARPAAIAAHALHWLCSYTKRKSNLGSSRPVPRPRFARLRFRNLTRADMNQRIAAAAAKVSERTSSASFIRVSRTRAVATAFVTAAMRSAASRAVVIGGNGNDTGRSLREGHNRSRRAAAPPPASGHEA
jgi:hypothetical protein